MIMGSEDGCRIYEELGVQPFINAGGNATVVGGSRLSPGVREAMEAANRYFVDMKVLLEQSGKAVAGMMGVEAALVTPGCAAALALGAAACMAGSDPDRIERLPDTTGMKNEILIQSRQRYKYDRCVTTFGAKLIEVGDEDGATAAQLEAALTENTAAMLYVAPGGGAGVLPPEEAIRICGARGVPVIADAAGQVYPIDRLRRYTDMGAGLVGYGAKYFGACNSTGVLCGRKDLVDAAFQHGFIGFETGPSRSVGRPLKLDRQEVIAVVAALREWLDTDHEARVAEHRRRARVIQLALEGIPHVTVKPVSDERTLGNGVRVTLDEGALGKTAEQVKAALLEGSPGIWVRGSGNAFNVNVPHLIEGEEQIVADRLREVLAGER